MSVVKFIGVLSGVASVWNGSDKSSGVTLSNLGRTATITVAVVNGVRGLTSHSSGVYMTSHTAGGSVAGGRIGFALKAWPETTAGVFLGNDANSVGLDTSGEVNNNGGVVFSLGFTWGLNDVIDLAINFTTAKIWVRKNGGLWNGNASANPGTGVQGIALTLNAGNYFPAYGYDGLASGCATTLNTKPSAPAGVTPWG